jgi:hypothetical protein
LTSATPSTLASVDDTTTVTGGNFASDVEIVFTGQDDVDRAAKNIVRSSSTSLIVARPDVFPVEQEPYTMTATNAGITNPSTGVNVLTDHFDAGGGITWVTTSPLPTAIKDVAYSVTLEATDADATSVGYALTAGSLPTGLSLNGSTGVISGTPTLEESQTFTVTATDAGGNSSAREFIITVLVPTLEYLVVAGGGAGGAGFGGGGGAGGYRSSVIGEASGGGASAETPFSFTLGTNYTVTVGAGGAPSTGTYPSGTRGGSGANSVFGTITSIGGGGGGTHNTQNAGASGGSGGGGSLAAASGGTGGAGTANQGYAGGTSPNYVPTDEYSGGGGGAGAVGAGGSSSSGGTGGDGGVGVASSITGASIYRAGGGGGSGRGVIGLGGLGGGGNGGLITQLGVAGAANTGGGGGALAADSSSLPSPAGGSGVVIIRYSASLNVVVGAGLSSYTLTDGTKKVTVFTAGSDNISFEGASAEVTPVDYLVVAGGGAGGLGNSASSGGGGGGAGGYRTSVDTSGGSTSPELSLAFASTASYTITIGAGGAAPTTGGARGNPGVSSSVAGLISIGGGGGGGSLTGANQGPGGSGGSGGGAGAQSGLLVFGGVGYPTQGFSGTNAPAASSAAPNYGSGGGGGAGAVGALPSATTGGAGGAGLTSTITGTSVIRGGGGGGSTYQGGTAGAGGTGGGGSGSNGAAASTAGAVNTGGGGGGKADGGVTAPGGSGVVILRYPSTKTLTVGAGLTADAPITVGANKVTVLKAGTGTVSLS